MPTRITNRSCHRPLRRPCRRPERPGLLPPSRQVPQLRRPRRRHSVERNPPRHLRAPQGKRAPPPSRCCQAKRRNMRRHLRTCSHPPRSGFGPIPKGSGYTTRPTVGSGYPPVPPRRVSMECPIRICIRRDMGGPGTYHLGVGGTITMGCGSHGPPAGTTHGSPIPTSSFDWGDPDALDDGNVFGCALALPPYSSQASSGLQVFDRYRCPSPLDPGDPLNGSSMARRCSPSARRSHRDRAISRVGRPCSSRSRPASHQHRPPPPRRSFDRASSR